MADFTIKKSTTKPWLTAALEATDEETGEMGVIDLTEAETVYALIKGPVTIKAIMEIRAAAEGKVRYKWKKADTASVGKYEVEFLIVWKDGSETAIPEIGAYSLEVTERKGE